MYLSSCMKTKTNVFPEEQNTDKRSVFLCIRQAPNAAVLSLGKARDN